MSETRQPTPVSDVTDGQRALMREISEKVAKKEALPIARTAIEEWQSGRARLLRPRTWRRGDHYLVEAFGIFTFLMMIFGAILTDIGRDAIHSGIDTNGKLDAWAQGDKFQSTIGGVVRTLAREPDEANPIRDLITATLRQNPMMVFQGEQTFLAQTLAQTDYGGCFAIRSYLEKLHAAVLKGVAGTPQEILVPDKSVCEIEVRVMSPSSLTVPFFARLGGGDPARDDDVRLFVHVTRAIAEKTTENNKNTIAPLSPLNGQLKGLKVVLHSEIADQNTRKTREMTIPYNSAGDAPTLTPVGFGYWEIALRDIVKPSTQTEPTQAPVFARHHAIEVSIAETESEDQEKDPQILSDERIHVRVFVFVNALTQKR